MISLAKRFVLKYLQKIRYRLSSSEEKERIVLLRRIQDNGFVASLRDNHYHVHSDEFQDVKLRKAGSDLSVFFQIFIRKEYEVVIDFIRLNAISPLFIIDCGGNIGLTSLLLAKRFPAATIYAIEPDPENSKLASENTQQASNVVQVQKAVWPKRGRLTFDRSFRDGQNWSIRTIAADSNETESVEAVTIAEVMHEAGYNFIDFLKIDVEGAESALFENYESASFLTVTGLIAIEIHDEFGHRERIYDVLRHYGFVMFNSGELTIGYRK